MVNGTILLIDNYDSFAHNLARYLVRLGQQVQVFRNDAVDLPAVRRLRPAAIVLSPGPGHPRTAGCSVSLVEAFSGMRPILGVCLGHQAIITAFGGDVVRAAMPVHGRASTVHHDRQGIFAGVPQPFPAGRYHSLVADPTTLPAELEVRAITDDGEVMAVQHRSHPTVGLQFHPESILTEHGYLILENFLRLGDFVIPRRRPDRASELCESGQAPSGYPRTPATF